MKKTILAIASSFMALSAQADHCREPGNQEVSATVEQPNFLRVQEILPVLSNMDHAPFRRAAKFQEDTFFGEGIADRDILTHIRVEVEGAYDGKAYLMKNDKINWNIGHEGYYDYDRNVTTFCISFDFEEEGLLIHKTEEGGAYQLAVRFSHASEGWKPRVKALTAVKKAKTPVIDVPSDDVPSDDVPSDDVPSDDVPSDDGTTKEGVIQCSSEFVKGQLEIKSCRLPENFVPGTLEVESQHGFYSCVRGKNYWVEGNCLVVKGGCGAQFTYKHTNHSMR